MPCPHGGAKDYVVFHQKDSHRSFPPVTHLLPAVAVSLLTDRFLPLQLFVRNGCHFLFR